jgi:hypothetical protein
VVDPIKPNQSGLPPPKLAAAVRATGTDLCEGGDLREAALSEDGLLDPYNLSLLGGALAASVLTLNSVLALGALGAEAIWLLQAGQSNAAKAALGSSLREDS